MTRTSYVEVFPGKDAQWYVREKAANHRTLNISEGYSRRDSALRGARRLQRRVAIRILRPDGMLERVTR